MSQQKSKNVAQVGGTKSDETENPPVVSIFPIMRCNNNFVNWHYYSISGNIADK